MRRPRLLRPIFAVEIVTTVRRARYFILRMLYGLLLLLVLWASYGETFGNAASATIATAARFGEAFFYSFATLQLMVATVVAAALTAGTIAEERERRTIEYLFASDLISLCCRTSTRAMSGSMLVSILLGGAYLIPVAMFLDDQIDRGNNVFCQIIWAPPLIAWPGQQNPHRRWNTPNDPLSLYLAGIIAYVIAGALLFAFNVWRFDRWAGRTTSGPRAVAPSQPDG